MNKLYGEGKDGKWIACILEPGNIHRLKNNDPIIINLNEGMYASGLPAKLQILLAYSETPVADMRHFRELIKPGGYFEDARTPVSEKKRPHCPECKSTIEQLGVWRSDDSPLWLTFCYVCGCVFGVSQPIDSLRKK